MTNKYWSERRGSLSLDHRHLPSALRSIFKANTFCPSFDDPARHDSQTLANVPSTELATTHMDDTWQAKDKLTSSDSLDEFKVTDSQLL